MRVYVWFGVGVRLKKKLPHSLDVLERVYLSVNTIVKRKLVYALKQSPTKYFLSLKDISPQCEEYIHQFVIG